MNYSQHDIIKLTIDSISKINQLADNKLIELEKEFSNILSCDFSSAHDNINDVLRILIKYFGINKELNVFLIGSSCSKLKKYFDVLTITCKVISIDEYIKFNFDLSNQNYLVFHDYKKIGLEEVEKINNISQKNNIPTIEYFINKDMVDLVIGTEADHLPCYSSDFSIFEIFPPAISKFFGTGIILNSKKHNIKKEFLNLSKLSTFKASLTLQIFEDLQNKKISNKPKARLLVLYNEENLSWWCKSNNLKKYLSLDILIEVKKIGTAFNEADYDFIITEDTYSLSLLNELPRNKLVIANESPKLNEETINTLINNHVLAAFTFNYNAYLSAKDKIKLYYCENLVDTDLFYPSEELPDVFKACWVGNSRSNADKGLGIIELACKKAGIELLKLDTASFTKLTDMSSPEWLRDNIYHKASVFISASELEDSENYILESLACGLPVISTRSENMSQILKDNINGFLIDRDAESICNAINKLKLLDLNKFKINARLSVDEIRSWNHNSQNYKDMIYNLINQRDLSEEDLNSSKTAISCLDEFINKLPELNI